MSSLFGLDPKLAHTMVGQQLPGGWTITEKVSPDAPSTDHTGGFFSVGYLANDGKTSAFVKVFDIAKAIENHPNDVMTAFAVLSRDHAHETTLLDICETARLDRIVRVLGRGQVTITGSNGMSGAIPYIIFEYADGETLRKAVTKADAIDTAWKLRRLHQVALGLQQLHSQQIAHQDLKPSNVLLFIKNGAGAKIGDLGRATHSGGIPMPHDGEPIAGDAGYAPPEQAYGVRAEQRQDRREGCDLYQLGNLLCFVFTGTVPTSAYLSFVPDELRPPRWRGRWGGDYSTVLPHLQAAFAKYLQRIEPALPDLPKNGREEIMSIVRNLCTPEYQRRGDPDARSQVGAPLGLDRFISRLDRLATIALIAAKSA